MKKKGSDGPELFTLNLSTVSVFEVVSPLKDGLQGWQG